MIMAPAWRKGVLTSHIVSAVGWLGAVAAFLALATAGLSSTDALFGARCPCLDGRHHLVPHRPGELRVDGDRGRGIVGHPLGARPALMGADQAAHHRRCSGPVDAAHTIRRLHGAGGDRGDIDVNRAASCSLAAFGRCQRGTRGSAKAAHPAKASRSCANGVSALPSGSMPMPMVSVRHVRVIVNERYVAVRVSMRLPRRIVRAVLVLVVRVMNV